MSTSLEFGTSQAWERVQPERFLSGMSRKIVGEQSCPEKCMKWESRIEEKSQEVGDGCLEKGLK